MFLIAGLGNPGRQYQNTRHNVGFMVVDLLAGGNKWHTNAKFKAEHCHLQLQNQEVELLKPQTMMNNSGMAVKSFQQKHNLDLDKIIIIHDDLDLPLGQLRISQNISSAGHNGIKSIIQYLDSQNFIRFRLGIKTDKLEKIPAEKFVLQNFNGAEKKLLQSAFDKTIQAVEFLITHTLEETKNSFN
ncbi:MAG: aminoacyl-tRNA hydrolase [Patescibacteria group bacterium]|nr:aminoacyl-tRNA hydrolase [Patescibacteria group bacterium]